MQHKYSSPCVGPGCFICSTTASRARAMRTTPGATTIARLLVPALVELCAASRLLHAEWIHGPLPAKPNPAQSQKSFYRLCQVAQGAVPFSHDVVRRELVTLFKVLVAFGRMPANVEPLRIRVKEICMREDQLLRRVMQFPVAHRTILRSGADVGFNLAALMLDMRLERWDPAEMAREWYEAGVDHHCRALVAGVLADASQRTRGGEERAEALRLLLTHVDQRSTAARRLALAMAFHARLGAAAGIGVLSADVVAEVAGVAEPRAMVMWSI